MPDQVRRVTHTRITANQGREIEKLKRRPAGAGFDPNEDPVIIGLGATAGGGSTPSSVSGGSTASVAIGQGAIADGDSSIAIGLTASADLDSCIAIGDGSSAPGNTVGLALAVGALAAANGDNSVAIGYKALVRNDASTTSPGISAVAIGDHATCGAGGGIAEGDFSIAIGKSAATGGVGHSGANAIAIGSEASSYTNAVAVGFNALAHGAQAIALGYSSNASGADGIAVGESATASGTNSIALGLNAGVAHNNAVAIGVNAATRAANQIALGATGRFVELPLYNSTYGSILTLQSPNGTLYALQVSNAGVLSAIASPV